MISADKNLTTTHHIRIRLPRRPILGRGALPTALALASSKLAVLPADIHFSQQPDETLLAVQLTDIHCEDCGQDWQ